MSTGLNRHHLESQVPLYDQPVHVSTRPADCPAQQDESSRLVFLTEPHGVAVEQYKLLRHRLARQHPAGGVMLVTSPGPDEGKTLTSANLAWAFAEAGHRTCLVDLDLRAPGLSRALDLQTGDFGVEHILSGESKIHQVLRPSGKFPFAVLPVRRRSASPGSLLSPFAVAPLLDKLRAVHDWVLLDLAPALPMADVAELLPHVNGALLVLRYAKSSKALIAPTLDVLGAALWGVVFNDAAIHGSEYYGSYGGPRKDRTPLSRQSGKRDKA